MSKIIFKDNECPKGHIEIFVDTAFQSGSKQKRQNTLLWGHYFVPKHYSSNEIEIALHDEYLKKYDERNYTKRQKFTHGLRHAHAMDYWYRNTDNKLLGLIYLDEELQKELKEANDNSYKDKKPFDLTKDVYDSSIHKELKLIPKQERIVIDEERGKK